MGNEIQEAYETLKNTYNLPSFEELDHEFEISTVEEPVFLLRNILRRISEKAEFYNSLLSDLLQPDTANLASMHEIRFFNDAEKTKIYSLIKQFMKTNRTMIEVMLDGDEAKIAALINDLYASWPATKKELASYVKKMKESWDHETTIQEDLGYFG